MHSQTHVHIKRLLGTFGQTKKPVLLDYGCGSGDLLEVISKTSLEKYVGYDINEASLTALKKRFPSKRVSTVLIDKNGTYSLGKSASADVIVSIGVLQYMNDKELKLLFKEARRVLKRGGSFIFSCAHDQPLYKSINIYGLFLPNRYFSRSKIKSLITSNDLTLKYFQARGPLLNPLFSYFFVFFFDALDKLVFKTKGTIGPIGNTVRALSKPILNAELDLNLNIGYTLFVVASK